MWEIEITDECRDWYEALSEDQQAPIDAAVELLEEHGPNLGRPLVDIVKGSKLHNLKELRPSGTSFRILFVFDPRRHAVLLVGADKAEKDWNRWYDAEGKPQAEALYDKYLADLRKEGLTE